MPLDEFKQLDQRIQAAVNKIQQLRRDNERLTQKLAESERRLEEAGSQIKQLEIERRQHEAERNEVKSRVEKILTRFDGIDLG